jgi:homoserine kinase
MTFTLRVPGSTANLGPGFDALGMALSIYNCLTITTQKEPGIAITVKGEGEGVLATDDNNLFYQAALHTAKKANKPLPGLHVDMQNDVPLSRGLGSSSTAIVAGVVAANHLLGSPFSQQNLLNQATELEGHPDNVSPCLLGGLTISTLDGNNVVCVRVLPPNPLQVVVAIPDFELKTSDARNALPKTLSLKDAVFNISRACIITAALITGDLQHIQTGVQDRLHQPYRASLIPGFDQVLLAATKAGALGAALSGAGPTVMALATQNATQIGQAMINTWSQEGVAARFRVLSLDTEGVVIL